MTVLAANTFPNIEEMVKRPSSQNSWLNRLANKVEETGLAFLETNPYGMSSAIGLRSIEEPQRPILFEVKGQSWKLELDSEDLQDLQNQQIATERLQAKWNSIEMHWKERLPGNEGELHHVYRPLLNGESNALYTDNTLKFVAKKCFLLLFARPLHAVIKTLYHICLPISIPCEIYLAVKKEVEAQKGKQRNIPLLIIAGLIGCLKNFADIIRTPLYGIALTLLLGVGIVLGIIDSEKIYDLREIAGKIELSLLWGNKKSIWMLAPCFQETTNFKELEANWGEKIHPDTNYDGLTPREKAEANLARAVFQHRRNHRAIVYGCKLWPKNIPLDSATYRTC